MDYKSILGTIRKDGMYRIGMEAFSLIDNRELPKEKIHCYKCGEITTRIIAVGRNYYNGKEYYILYCPKCRTFSFKKISDFHHVPKSFKFDHSTERIQKMKMKLEGYDEEYIEAMTYLNKEDWQKQDELEAKREARSLAERKYFYEEEQLSREQAKFKARLDAGEIKYSSAARAFYEVSSGKIVRKL